MVRRVTASQGRAVERIEHVIVRRAAPWPFAPSRYSVVATELDGSETAVIASTGLSRRSSAPHAAISPASRRT